MDSNVFGQLNLRWIWLAIVDRELLSFAEKRDTVDIFEGNMEQDQAAKDLTGTKTVS